MIKLHEIKSITRLALPLMAAFLAQKGMQLIDTVMMGWIGPSALAAGSLGTGVFSVTLVFCMGTLSAVGVFIARAKGANDFSDVKSSMQHGMCLTMLLTLPSFLIIWFSPQFLLMLGEDPAVVKNVALLVHGLVWGFPGFLLFLVFREFVAAFSLTKVVMVIALGSIPLTFIANYALIYGKLGFPVLGIAGIGYAGAVIMWFMFLCLFFYSKNNARLKEYISFVDFQFEFRKIYSMLYIGAPSGALFVLESGMFFAATLMMGYFGMDALAAFQIAMQCANVAYAVPFSLSMATALRVGHSAGAKNLDELKRSFYVSLTIGFVFMTVAAVFIIAMPGIFVKLFLSSNQSHYQIISEQTRSFMIIVAFFQCLDAVQAIANGALRGMKDTAVPMLLSIGCYWLIGTSAAYGLAFFTHLGAIGIWLGLTAGIWSAGIVLLWRFMKKLKQAEVAHAKGQFVF